MGNKEEKESDFFKSVCEYTAGISVVWGLLSILISTLFNFGFFLYFKINIFLLPISVAEIMKDTMVIFPVGLLPLAIAIFQFAKHYDEEKNKSDEEKNTAYLVSKYGKTKVFISLFIIAILTLLIFAGIWHIAALLSAFMIVVAIAMITKYAADPSKRLPSLTLFMIVLIISSPIIGYSYAIWIDKIQKPKEQQIFLKGNNSISTEVKILKVYDKGILFIREDSTLAFIYSDEVGGFSLGKARGPSFSHILKK